MEPKKITYQEAMARDVILFDLARYDAMGGLVPFAETQEEMVQLQLETHKKSALLFNKYKKLIRMGEFTFEEMVDDILARNAAFEQPKDTINSGSDKDLNDMVDTFEKRLTKKENRDSIDDLTEKLNKVLLGYQQDYDNYQKSKTSLDKSNPTNPNLHSKKSSKKIKGKENDSQETSRI